MILDSPSVFETERLYLRQLTIDDIDNLQKIFSDPIAMQYYPKTLNIKETRAWIETALESYGKYGFGLWACHLLATEEFVGQCGLVLQEDIDGKEEIEVGYLFVRQHWRQGLATEAARGSLQYARQVLRTDRIISLIHPLNIASQRVAEKNSLQPEKKVKFKGRTHIVYVTRNGKE